MVLSSGGTPDMATKYSFTKKKEVLRTITG
jgi:hypothetical protein